MMQFDKFIVKAVLASNSNASSISDAFLIKMGLQNKLTISKHPIE